MRGDVERLRNEKDDAQRELYKMKEKVLMERLKEVEKLRAGVHGGKELSESEIEAIESGGASLI